jgi:hypothetical protein
VSAEIAIVRPKSVWIDRFGSYKVLLDGNSVEKIRSGETVTLSVRPGAHRLQLQVDWTGSPELELDLQAGETAEVVVGRPGRIFSRDGWLSLRRIE